MKLALTLIFGMFLLIPLTGHTQNIDDLKAQRDSLKGVKKEVQQQLSAVDKELNNIKKELEILSGWRVDGSTVIGLTFTRTNNWVGNANPNAITSSLSIAGAFSAQKNKRKSFWRNNASINLSWQSLDVDTGDGESTGFLADRTADIFTVSSLYGFTFDRTLSLSLLGDVNTALFNFFDTGSGNISAGFTWKPPKRSSLVLVGHFISYQVAFTENVEGNTEIDRAVGAKLKVSYAGNLPLKIKWTSNLNSFIPYREPQEESSSLFEYTWINNFAVKFWKSFGIGVNLGLRKANFEVKDTQWFSALGLSVSI